MKKLRKLLGTALALCLLAGTLAPTSLAATSFTYTCPTEPMDVTQYANVLTTMAQRAGSEIPLIFGLNVVGGNIFSGLQYIGGTAVNENPDPYIWNFNYMYPDTEQMTIPTEVAEGREELPEGTYYVAVGNELNNANGLYDSGGANQNYSVAYDELGGVGYAIGFRNDVIIGFNTVTVDQIDLVRSWTEGDEFYQEGDENYSPLIIDVQTGSVTSRLYAWAEMGQALSAYLEANPDKTVRYGDPYTIAVNLEEFCAGIPYYIAAKIADGTIAKKTAAYVSAIDGYTLTCVDPGTVGTVAADVYAEVHNFNFLTGSFTLSDLMDAGVDVIILAASGYGYTAAGSASQNQAVTDSKQDVLMALADLGYTPDEVPLVIGSDTISKVTIGSNGYNYAPTTPLFLPFIQAYAYMDDLAEVNPAINPVAMLQYALDEFCHVEESSSADVALYYIGSYWDSVDEDYDRVPDLVDYVYDKDAIVQAIQEGIAYALSGQAEANGNTLLPAVRETDNAYLILTQMTSSTVPEEGHDYITLTIDGETKYLDLTVLAATEGEEVEENEDGEFAYYDARTEYQAIIDYYNSGKYGYGDDLQTTLQNYADHMVAHVWSPDTTAENTYGYGMSAAGDGEGFSDVASTAWYAEAVAYVSDNGIMNGTSATTFAPADVVTRGTVMTMLARYAGTDTSGSSPWYQAGVDWAVANGVSDGTGQEAEISREQLLTMLWRCVGSPEVECDLTAFADAADISDWALSAVQWAVETGIVEGTGTGSLNPGGTTTRAEIATIMMRFCQSN